MRLQMRVACATRRTSKACRRSHSARSRTTFARNTPASRRASASCCCDCRPYGPCRRRSSSRCSSYDWSARRRLRRSSEICCSAAARSVGRTCTPFNDVTASTCYTFRSPPDRVDGKCRMQPSDMASLASLWVKKWRTLSLSPSVAV